MYKDVSKWLFTSRLAIGLSLADLARFTDLTYSTLSRLEHGTTRPTTFTLKALFKVLNTPDHEQIEVLGLVQRPRALKQLSATVAKLKLTGKVETASIYQGSTIRDLRTRCGLSQEQLAEKVGSTQPKISSWEHLKSSPSAEDRIKLVSALNPTPLEDFVLRSGELLIAPQVLNQRFLDNCAHDLYDLVKNVEVGEKIPDGQFLLLEDRLRRLTGLFPSAWSLLMQAYCWHGECLIRWSRCNEMDPFAHLALDVMVTQCQEDPDRWRAISLMARKNAEIDPKRGFAFMKDWAKDVKHRTGACQLLRDAASYADQAGFHAPADYLMEQVKRVSTEVLELAAYKSAHADLLRKRGKAYAALEILGDDTPDCPFQHMHQTAQRAHSLLDVKEYRTAAANVRIFQTLADRYNFPHLRDQLNWMTPHIERS